MKREKNGKWKTIFFAANEANTRWLPGQNELFFVSLINLKYPQL